uniref:hypothetical protein n=1 Tax=Gelidibacter sp. TaxID=2018083 RepID=UPI00404A317C
MKKLLKLTFLFFTTIMITNCGSNDDDDDDCTKTITIPQAYFANGQTYSYDIEQEVPCDFPEPEEPVLIEPPVLANFTYEVLYFTYTPDTGNNTSRLQFEIQLNNGNNYDVNGVPILTIQSDELEFTGSYSQIASIPCYSIQANSNCILTVDIEESLDLGSAGIFELIDVNYYLTN